MIRILTIAHNAVLAPNQYKFREWARRNDWAITNLVPAVWREGEQDVPAVVSDDTERYRTIVVQPRGRMWLHGHSHWYPGLESLWREAQPDLVFCSEEPWTFMAWRVCRLRKKLSPETGLVFYSWQNIFKHLPPPFGLWEAQTLREADSLWVPGKESAALFRKKGYRGALEMIPEYGIDPVQFSRKRPSPLRGNIPSNAFVAGFIGRLVPEKGVDLLVRALPQLPAAVHLLIAGAGPELNPLQQMTERLHVQERVHFLGPVAPAQIPVALNAMDVLVLPSRTTRRWKEQFGKVLVEAMACELPVIGSSSGEIPSVIGEAGLVFQEGNVGALADCLSDLEAHPDRVKSLGQKARDRALRLYSWEVILERMMESLRTVYERRRQAVVA